ncbi:hypothetical protein K1719_012996 [Acacia pycnantha]|nr:hypothetical protein K1719_012996 [Acacia pycnantha]
MQKRRRESLIFVSLLLCLITLTQSAPVSIPVGVILDSNSSLVNTTLNIALQDFYDTHDSYTTRLQLIFSKSENDLQAAYAAWYQINKQNVSAILGPQNSEHARYVVEYGDVAKVPVIWFSPSGPSLMPPRTRFFLHSNSNYSTISHCSQFGAIAAIIKAYNWQSVIPIYEEPEFGYDLIPCLSYALQDMDTRVPNTSAISQNFTDDQITEELKKIKDNRTHVFVAHMTVELWSRLVKPAQNAGMMDKGNAWILTQGLSSVLNPKALNVTAEGYMDFALGVKPLLNDSNMKERILLSTELMSKCGKTLSLYGLWAYDTITALADAVENAGLVNYDVANRGIPNMTLSGLSGNFDLTQGQLEPSEFVVYNVKNQTERIIGYWRPKTGLHQNDNVVVEWPNDTMERPLKKLKIGVPTKANFIEFANVTVEGQSTSATGFAVEVFTNVVEVLQFDFEFVPVDNTNGYYGLLCNITDKNVDVIIGDITIVENRTKCVDFTMPYLDSSVSMVIKVRSDSKNGWILLKPFDWKLWLILGLIFVGATVIVIILERKTKDDTESKFRHFVRNPFLVCMSDVESLRSDKSKWVVIVVMFVLTIAMQVYTANLTANLSERITTKPPSSKDLQEIRRNSKPVGYQKNSWVREFLIQQIGLKEDQLKPLENHTEYETALSKENKENVTTVDAIFDETPYLMLLLSNCSSCKMTGPIYKAGGFAFAFPKNSALVSKFSAAILNVTQNVTMFCNMRENISLPTTVDKSEYKSDVEMRGLRNRDFGGLFPIVYSVLALFFTISILKIPSVVLMLKKVPPIAFLLKKVSSIADEFDHVDKGSHTVVNCPSWDA